MLLLVVGLVVLVLVILVVVFLSVRSMRADEVDSYQARSPRRDDAGRGRAQSGEPRRRAPEPPARRRAAGDGEPAFDRGERDFEVAALPRQRGYQHDQDDPGDTGRGGRDAPRRRSRSAPPARTAGDGRGRDGDDWSRSDWGGVSDEQYWAELSSDKPLATTARSAQAGPHAAARAVDDDDAGDRDAGQGMTFPERREPARSMAGAGSLGTRQRRSGGGEPAPFRDAPAADSGAPDTDPGLGGSGRWPDAAGDGARTESWTADRTESWTAAEAAPASWAAQDATTDGWAATDSPTTAWSAREATGPSWAAAEAPSGTSPGWGGTQDAATDGWAGRDEQAGMAGRAGGWQADEPAASAWTGDGAAADEPAWTGDDPLTSPSFATPDGYADGRSYRGTRDRAQREHTDGYDHQPADPGWAGSGAAGSYDSSYGGQQNGWAGAGDAYPASHLEPLPEPAGQNGQNGSWHSASVPADDPYAHSGPAAQDWDQAGHGYHDDPRYPSSQNGHDTGYGPGGHDAYNGSAAGWNGAQGGDWASQGHRDWPGSDRRDGRGYGDTNGYHTGNGQQYGQAADYEYGYGQAPYGQASDGNGYGSRGRHGQEPGHGFDIGHR